MERPGESREVFDPREALEICLIDRREIQNYGPEELLELMEYIQALLIEIDPSLKGRYRTLLTAIAQHLGSNPFLTVGQSSIFSLQNEYEIRPKNAPPITLESTIFIKNNYADATRAVECGLINREAINPSRTSSATCLITAVDGSCYINIRILDIGMRDGSRKRVLYIADKYAAPNLRGKGVGIALTEMAEMIARTNGCSTIFGIQMPENPVDLEAMLRGKQKAGYQISRMGENLIFAKKEL